MAASLTLKQLDACPRMRDRGLGESPRHPWAEAVPAPAKPKRLHFEPGEAVLVQLPQPDGTFKTLAGNVLEDWNDQVRACTGKGENRKFGTFSAGRVYPQDTAWATGEEGVDKDCIIPECDKQKEATNERHAERMA